MKATDFIVEFLSRKGIHDFFGYQGTMIAHLVDSIDKNPDTNNHSSYHEQGAAFAACGYARARGSLAVAYATSGPGAANLLSGIANAYFDSLPVLFLTGQLNTYEYSGIRGLRQQGFQEIDIISMAKPVTKYAVHISDPQDLIREMNLAYTIATEGRKGAVLIDLPMDVQRADLTDPVYDMEFSKEQLLQQVQSHSGFEIKGSGTANPSAENAEPVQQESASSINVPKRSFFSFLSKKKRPDSMENPTVSPSGQSLSKPGDTGSKTAEHAAASLNPTYSCSPHDAAAEILNSLQKSRRPLIMAGQGILGQAGNDLIQFCRQLNLPIVTSILAKDIFSYDDPLNFGCIGGAYGHRCANMIANAKADLLVCLGISLCTRQIGTKVSSFAEGTKIIRVDIDPVQLQRQIHQDGSEKCFLADARDVIKEMLRQCSGQEAGLMPSHFQPWLSICTEIRSSLAIVDDEEPLRWTNRLIAHLSDSLSDASAVCVDVGQHMVWTYQSFRNQKDQKLVFSGGHGAMGFALPAACGAYYATGQPVACICGDGALMMNIQELQWMVREQIPIRLIVFNNQSLGMIRHLQRDYFEEIYAGTSPEGGFTSCSFTDVADAYGLMAMKIKTSSDKIPDRAARFLSQPGPRLLEFVIEPGTFAYPKTSLGEPIHDQQPYIPPKVYQRLMKL